MTLHTTPLTAPAPTTATPPTDASRLPSAWSTMRAALGCEWRILRADPALWLTLALLVGAVFYAVGAGAEHWRRQGALVAAAQAEEVKRLAALRTNLTEVEAGRITPASPFRDPRSALWVGLTHGATQVALQPAPLAAAAVGLSDLHPAAVKVSARTKDEFLFADEIRNPLHLLAGAVDLAFVLVLVLPLAVLALSYNLVSQEREQGTLALAACTGTDLRRVLGAKLLVRAGLPAAATLAAMVVALLLAGAPPSWPLAGLLLATALYAAFWAALAGFVNGRGRDSAHNALALAGSWIALVLIVPAAVNLLADTLYPVPSRAEMVLAVRGASVDADKERDATLARYREEHRDAQPDELRRGSPRERVARRIAVVDASAARVEAVVALHDAQLARRQQLIDRLAVLSPALLMQLAVTDLAGSGNARYAAFYRQVDAFHAEWRAFFLGRARADRALSGADYAAFPVFRATTPDTPASVLLPRLMGLALLASGLVVLAGRGLRRSERSG